MIGWILYALFVFWISGVISVLIDIDHIFVLTGRKPPIKFSDTYGRPLHSRVIFTLVAVGISFVMATFVDGLYREILLGCGVGGAILFLVGLIVITGVVTKKVGRNFGNKLREQRQVWRRDYTQKAKGL